MSDSANDAVRSENKPANSGKPSFWHGVKFEFKKIIWPSRDTLVRQSTAVVIVSVIVGAIIAVIDRAVLYGINFLIK